MLKLGQNILHLEHDAQERTGDKEDHQCKCKINWEAVCRPTHVGGLGILHLQKFAHALCLRWPWFQWRDPKKFSVSLGTPCDSVDMSLFYAATTTTTTGNGSITHFWDFTWLNGRMSKYIAPLIFVASTRKKWSVKQTLHNNI
jgi:hypothetical protein